MRHPSKIRRLLFILGAILVALLPIARLTRILAITGVDVPSSDDIFFIPNVVGRVFAGGYNWTNFPRDSFQNTHVTIVPGLAYLLMARFGHFNVYYALAFGVAAAAAKLVLLHDAFTCRTRSDDFFGRAALFVLLSAMIFSVTQISVFEHDFQTLKTGFTELGLAMGVWGFARFQDRWPAIVLACLGGIIASFSFANGWFLWLVFLPTMAALGSRKYIRYAAIALCAALTAAPYVYFLRINRVAGGQSKLVSVFDPQFVLSAFGRPFSNDIGFKFEPRTGEIAIGALGVALFVALLAMLLRSKRGRDSLVQSIPAVSVAAFSLLTILQISMFRGLVAPWYTTFAMDLWIGTAGLGYLLWAREPGSRSVALGRAAAAVAAVVIGVLFLTSNRSYSDKSFFLRTRGPAAAASLRNYLTAPTYAMDTLEIWRPADPSHFMTLGPTLERFNLSVFGPHQEWTLQGDWILDSVTFEGSRLGWAQGLSPKFVPFTDFRHLNLFLSRGDSVSWTVTVPQGTSKALFESAGAISGPARANERSNGELRVTVAEEGGSENLAAAESPKDRGKWTPITVSLSEYAGKRVTLSLSYRGDVDDVFGVFRFPRIVLDQPSPPSSAFRWRAATPSNTDLSPYFRAPGASDLSFETGDGTRWTVHDLKAVDGSDGKLWSVSGPDPWLQCDEPLDIDTSEYSGFFVTMTGTGEQIPGVGYGGDLYPGGIRVDLRTEESPNFGTSFQMPILYDHAQHSYSYPLSKFGVAGRITGFRLAPVYPEYAGRKVVNIDRAGFMKNRRMLPVGSYAAQSRIERPTQGYYWIEPQVPNLLEARMFPSRSLCR